jgi:hypothetical protein
MQYTTAFAIERFVDELTSLILTARTDTSRSTCDINGIKQANQ